MITMYEYILFKPKENCIQTGNSNVAIFSLRGEGCGGGGGGGGGAQGRDFFTLCGASCQ